MPSLTVQYMSDSGTVELSRDCGEEGTRHMPCRGSIDHDAILNELTCVDASISTSSSSVAAASTAIDNTESPPASPSTPPPSFSTTISMPTTTTTTSTTTTTTTAPRAAAQPKSVVRVNAKYLDLIKNVVSDNEEDNNVNNAHIGQIEKPNRLAAHQQQSAHTKIMTVEEFMMGDQPVAGIQGGHDLDRATVAKKIIREKQPKKVQPKDKWIKKQYGKKANKKIDFDEDDEMMMADQPIDHQIVTDQSQAATTNTPSSSSLSTMNPVVATTMEAAGISTTESRSRRQTEMADSNGEHHSTEMGEIISNAIGGGAPTTETPSNTANVHPPKMSRKTSNSYQVAHKAQTDGTRMHNEKLDVDETVDHFIPPMLLVRTKFNAGTKTVGSDAKHEENGSTAAHDSTTDAAKPTETITEMATTTAAATTNAPPATTTFAPSTTTEATEKPVKITESSATPSEQPATISTEITGPTEDTNQSIDLTTASIHTEAATSTGHPIGDLPKFRQPHAPQRMAETILVTVATPSAADIEQQSSSVVTETTPSSDLPPSISSTTPEAVHHFTSPTTHAPAIEDEQQSSSIATMALNSSVVTPIQLQAATASAVDITTGDSTTTSDGASQLHTATSIEDDENNEEDGGSDFTNADNFQPYRPNRRRTLTKAETHNYMKKILG